MLRTKAVNAITDPLAEARRLGRLEAERFEQALREAERRRREERLCRLALAADDGADIWIDGGDVSPRAVARLQRDLDRLAAFHTAVVRSKGWRLLQALRRPFGRTW